MLVSVVIPVLNEAPQIALTLEAARRGYGPDEVEIIVVDGGSSDGTLKLIPPDVLLLHAPRGRAVQLNRGAVAARGEVLLFCHSDSELPVGWREALLRALDRPKVAGGVFMLHLVPARGILHLVNHLPLLYDWRTMYGDQGQFMKRETFERVGGYAEIPLMEDVEMMRRLRQYGKLVRLRQRLKTSSRRFLERGPLRQLCLVVTLVFRYLYLGASPETLARDYRNTRRDRTVPSMGEGR
jgi:rSAM/selenodomain-associated transferase 2